MKKQEVLLGAVLLLLSVTVLYPVFPFLIVDAALAMMLVGVVVLVHGLGLFDKAPANLGPEASQTDLSALDRVVLEMISQNKSQEEIAQSTGVSPDIVAAKSAALAASGYVLGNRLTEKGFDSLRGKPSTTPK